MTGEALFFVIFPEDGVWVAHGLQHNMVTHGESLQEVRENIDLVFEAYCQQGGYASLPKADSDKWELFTYAMKAGRDLDKMLEEPVQEEADSYSLELQTA